MEAICYSYLLINITPKSNYSSLEKLSMDILLNALPGFHPFVFECFLWEYCCRWFRSSRGGETTRRHHPFLGRTAGGFKNTLEKTARIRSCVWTDDEEELPLPVTLE